MDSNINERVRREAAAYDEGDVYQHSAKLQRRFWHVFSCPNTVYLQDQFTQAVAQKAPSNIVLDYGCLTGEFSKLLSAYDPKQIVGIDISSVGIAAAKQRYGDLAEFHVMDAHHTHFPDNMFDLVVGQSILHHLDWQIAIRELERILKPGGKAVFIEPLGDNPMAKLMRLVTPRARTRDEIPVTRRQIKQADAIMGNSYHRFGNLLSVPVAMLTSLLIKNPDSFPLRIADWADRRLAKSPFKYWMRTVVLVWEKQ